MADPKIDIEGVRAPQMDGDINEYTYPEALASSQFNPNRKVIFINGMLNKPADHVESAMALSWVQMCTVIGVYNASGGLILDFAQCVADKIQFNGPLSTSAKNKVAGTTPPPGLTTVEVAHQILSRNPVQVYLFDLLRKPENRVREIFAHSQGNLILSNVLQAIVAVDGPGGVSGRIVHTFGSPAVKWPTGIVKYEHGFTWDPVTFLAGFDSTWTISKVGMPTGSKNPITHGFLEYLKNDPAFVVNRFRWGSFKITFNMDEDGLAKALAEMGTNTRRVSGIFEHLNKKHNSDADDVAVRYVKLIQSSPSTLAAVKADKPLRTLLIRILDEGWTSEEEKNAITYLKNL